MKRFFLILWQFPQFLVGLILVLWYFRRIKKISPCGDNVILRVDGFPGGISLGPVVIVRTLSDEQMVKHELGHCKQSLYLGWLYLIIVGVPSLLWAWWWNPGRGNYYRFYTERWADKLGDVDRY